MTIHDQLAPAIRAAGIRRTASAAGVAHSTLAEWLGGRRARRLGDEQLDRIAAALGARWTLTCDAVSQQPPGEGVSQC